MTLEWDKEPTYHNWGNAPLYKVTTLSNILENPECLKPNMYVRAVIDFDISYEDSTVIKDEYIDKYKLRSLTLISDHDLSEDNLVEVNTQFQSVDEIISKQLTNITSESYDTNLLVKIYNAI